MSTNARDSKMVIDSLPRHAARIGVDGEGATHYAANPVVDGRAVIVADGDELERFDLEQMPGAGNPEVDIFERWHDFVAGNRGDWQTWTYRSEAGIAAPIVEGQA